MSGVCKIARGYFKLLRGQTASEKPASTSEVLSCMHKPLIQKRQSNAMGRTQDRESTELDSIYGLMPCPCNCTVPSSPHYHPPYPTKLSVHKHSLPQNFPEHTHKVCNVPPCCKKRRNYKSMHTCICICFCIHKTFCKLS